jgi:hypothetical protein
MSSAPVSLQSPLVKIARALAALGGAWGVGITLALLFLPIFPYCTATIDSLSLNSVEGPTPVTTCSNYTLPESQGGSLQAVTWAYFGGMTGLSLLAMAQSVVMPGRVKWRGLGLLGVCFVLAFGMLIGGFSIGLYYAPGVLLLLTGTGGLLVG